MPPAWAGAQREKALMKKTFRAGACATLLCFTSATLAEAKGAACATEAEISAIQVSAVHQEFTDAALACGALMTGTCTVGGAA